MWMTDAEWLRYCAEHTEPGHPAPEKLRQIADKLERLERENAQLRNQYTAG